MSPLGASVTLTGENESQNIYVLQIQINEAPPIEEVAELEEEVQEEVLEEE